MTKHNQQPNLESSQPTGVGDELSKYPYALNKSSYLLEKKICQDFFKLNIFNKLIKRSPQTVENQLKVNGG